MSQRLPFDPSRIRPPADEIPIPPDQPPLFTPKRVNELVRGALTREIPATLHVLGEIGNLSRPSSGHIYFTLKDAHSELSCVIWRSDAAKLKFTLEVGLEIIATGGIDVYMPRGTYQLYARKLEPRGVGALELAFRQLRERLQREGLFDPARKKILPRIPERIALVTSPAGAAIRDILQTLSRRYPALDILLFSVRVQGECAAAEIAGAINLLNQHNAELGGIDVAIIGRGGGSLEDLWAFNEEIVARAIAASDVPIVSAVGHEVDISISDLVADLRAPTPTAAAELIVPHKDDLLEWTSGRLTRASRAAGHAVEVARAHLNTILAYDGLARPVARLRERAQLIDELTGQLRLAILERFRHANARLNRAQLALVRFGSGTTFRRLADKLATRIQRLHRALGQPILVRERALAYRLARLGRVAPDRRPPRFDEHLTQLTRRITTAQRALLARRRDQLTARLEALTAYDPQNVLERGYSITRDARTRRIIRSLDQIRDKMRITTQLADGTFHSTADDPRQPTLFDEPTEPCPP